MVSMEEVSEAGGQAWTGELESFPQDLGFRD